MPMKSLIFALIFSVLTFATVPAELAWNEDVIVVVKKDVNSLLPLKKPTHVSPFCPTVMRVSKPDETVSIPNMHEVLSTEVAGVKVMRSNSPYYPEHITDVVDQGIGKVIVYKSFYKAEQRYQLEDLYRENGYDGELIFLDMPWAPDKETQEFDFVSSCKLTIQAMIAIRDAETPVLFHCTVGEDRTGMLAGILRVINNGWSIEQAFNDEMCANGYEAGNPRKLESFVVDAVRAGLTPLFLKMVTAIKQNNGILSESLCESLPTDYIDGIEPTDLTCEPVVDKARICEH